MAAAVTNVTTGDIRAQTVNIGGMNVPRSWLFGLSALIFSAFTYFGLIQPALFPPRLEISDSVIDGYLMSKGIPVTSAEAEALKEQFTRVSKDLEDLRARNPETGGRIAAAIEEFRKGSPEKAIVNLERLIEIIENQRQKITQDQATAEHALAALGYADNIAKALPHYRKAAELAATNVWYWIDYGHAEAGARNTNAAKAAYLEATNEAERQGDLVGRSAALSLLGDLFLSNGDIETAEQTYQKVMEIERSLTTLKPDDPDTARGLSLILARRGDISLERGNVDNALRSYSEALTIQRKESAKNEQNADLQRDVYISLLRIGSALKSQGDLEGALKAEREGIEIARQLASKDPKSVELQRDLAISLDGLGDVNRALNDLGKALNAYREALEIRRRLMASSPGDTEDASNVSVSLSKIGSLLIAHRNFSGALKAHEEALVIRRRLLATDPGSAGRAQDVFRSLASIGIAMGNAGKKDTACAKFTEALAIIGPLAEAALDNQKIQQDLVNIRHDIAQANCPA